MEDNLPVKALVEIPLSCLSEVVRADIQKGARSGVKLGKLRSWTRPREREEVCLLCHLFVSEGGWK